MQNVMEMWKNVVYEHDKKTKKNYTLIVTQFWTNNERASHMNSKIY